MVILLSLLALVHIVTGGRDPRACTVPQASQSGPKKPSFPNTFQVHVECTIVNKNSSTEMQEFFDYIGNRGVVRQRTGDATFYAYYDYNANELLVVQPKQRICTSQVLDTSSQRYLFGFNTTNGTRGRIYSASGVLHFNNGEAEVYAGFDVVRGIYVRKWYSCQYWQDMDATMNVTWYITDPNEWDMAIAHAATPVRAWVKGTVHDRGTQGSHAFEHIYDFIEFKSFIDTPEVFDLPSFVSCPRILAPLGAPLVEPEFSCSLEISNEDATAISTAQVWFDDILHLTKYRYTPGPGLGFNNFDLNTKEEIHDFNSGLAYTINLQLGNCSVHPIINTSLDVVDMNNIHVRMRTSREFFLVNNVTMTYAGIKPVRGMSAQVYVAKRSDFPPEAPVNSTMEWYIRTSNFSSVQDKFSTIPGVTPVQFRYYVPSKNNIFNFQIYNFIRAPVDVLNWDVSTCYINQNTRKFQFQVSGIYSTVIKQHLKDFRYSVLVTVANAANVDYLRVSEIIVEFDMDIHINFRLLGSPPVQGDASKSRNFTTMDEAAKQLYTAIKQGRLSLHTTSLIINPIPSSLVEIIDGTTASTGTTHSTTRASTLTSTSTTLRQAKTRTTTTTTKITTTSTGKTVKTAQPQTQTTATTATTVTTTPVGQPSKTTAKPSPTTKSSVEASLTSTLQSTMHSSTAKSSATTKSSVKASSSSTLIGTATTMSTTTYATTKIRRTATAKSSVVSSSKSAATTTPQILETTKTSGKSRKTLTSTSKPKKGTSSKGKYTSRKANTTPKDATKSNPTTSPKLLKSSTQHKTSVVTTQRNLGSSSKIGLCNTQDGYATGTIVGVVIAMLTVGGIIGAIMGFTLANSRQFPCFYRWLYGRERQMLMDS